MAYYTNLIVAWNSSIQPPNGYTGTGLSSGMGTQTKLDAVNAWSITGTIPSTTFVTGNQLANCVVWSEFTAKTSTQQDIVLQLCQIPGPLIGGSANVSLLTAGMMVSVFGSSSVTIANLTALAKGQVSLWTTNNGYSTLTGADATAAGLS